MSQVREKGELVRRYIIENIEKHPSDISRKAAEKFGITRQAVNKHLRKLVDEKALTESGETRSRVYKLAPLVAYRKAYNLAEPQSVAEDLVWERDIRPALGELPDNVRNIWHHGFTEMFNNALDHSEGKQVRVRITKTAATTEMHIYDDGVGIFAKIQKALNLADERHAVLELAKGKLTTDPARHSGEGIFFTSRMFDEFDIRAGGVFFSHDYGKEDWILGGRDEIGGTGVLMKLHNHSARTTRKVFDQFSSNDGEYKFNTTVVPVDLAQFGNDQLVSRSQAKRLLSRLELFDIVIFDFKDVPSIGQAFADEVFRVFAQQHPKITFQVIRANSEVKRMIERAKTSQPPPNPTPDLFSDAQKPS